MANERRLIDADEAKKALTGWDTDPTDEEIERTIDELPTIEATPVVHGRWVHVPSSDMITGKAYKCSECGKMRYGSYMPNYCQYCGSKMDGGVSDG